MTTTTTTTTAISTSASFNDLSLPTTTNVIVMSEAGKPIFVRYGSEEGVARLCGLVQALRTSIHSNSALGLGEIHSLISSKDTCVVFMTVGSITLLSISKQQKHSSPTVVAFARLQLEYVYAQLIFTLTDQVQSIYQHNPSYDLRSMISSSDNNLLYGMLDHQSDADSFDGRNFGPYMVSAVPTLFPLSYDLRHQVSKVLQSIAGKDQNNIVFALLVAQDKLVTLIQPYHRQHQLRVSDLHLIINFFSGKRTMMPTSTNMLSGTHSAAPTAATAELWIPMCLPRFNSSGFLYAYAKCLDIPTNLTLLLLSSHGTTEQFQILRNTSQQIQNELHLPSIHEEVNTIKDDTTAACGGGASSSPTMTEPLQVGWKKNNESLSSDVTTTEDDYVNISSDMVGFCTATTHVDGSVDENELLRQVRQATGMSIMDYVAKRYLEDDHELLFHFLFRLDVPIKTTGIHFSKHSNNHAGAGHLAQCISPPVRTGAPFERTDLKQKLWSNYQKLSLRLRLGSACIESTMDAFDMINDSCNEEQGNGALSSFPGIGKNCPAIGLLESPAYATDGLSYVMDDDGIFLGMNGKDFEL
jgi:hypothetical protein